MSKIMLKNKGISEIIDVDEIIYIHAEGNYSLVHTNKETIKISKTIGYFEKELADYEFMRVHNSHLVNMKHLKTVKSGHKMQINLTNNLLVPVSLSNREKFLDKLNMNHKKI